MKEINLIEIQRNANDMITWSELAKTRYKPSKIAKKIRKSLFEFVSQLHAISQKIQLPRSPVEQLSVEDFAHVLDFLSNIESLEVVGDRDFYLNSNLILNSLPYELTVFKQLKHLRFSGANVASLACARHLRAGVETLSAQHCGLKSIADLLICDNVHKTFDSKVSGSKDWPTLTLCTTLSAYSSPEPTHFPNWYLLWWLVFGKGFQL